MNKRITESFTKGKAFISFITCGDPSLEVTEQLVYAMEEAGIPQSKNHLHHYFSRRRIDRCFQVFSLLFAKRQFSKNLM